MKKITFGFLLFAFFTFAFGFSAVPVFADTTCPDGNTVPTGVTCPILGSKCTDGTYAPAGGTCCKGGGYAGPGLTCPTGVETAGTPAATAPTPSGGSAGTSFVPLTNIPGLTDLSNTGTTAGLSAFLNNLYKLCIGIAAALAVLQIMRAGIMYMGGDSITEKKQAKTLIGLSIGGLILVLTPVIVFSIINPKILNLTIDTSALTPTTTPQTAQEQDQATAALNPGLCLVYEPPLGATMTATLSEGETCASHLNSPDWQKINSTCCMAASGATCCGRAAQNNTPAPACSGPACDFTLHPQTSFSYKIAVQSTSQVNGLPTSCVRYFTGSASTASACTTQETTAESQAGSGQTLIQDCGGIGQQALPANMSNLPTCGN